MTEHEKIFAGKMFNPRGAELKAVKHKAHNLCVEYNMLTEDNPRRAEIIHEMLGAHGESVNFQGPVQFNYGMHTKVGSNFFANYNFIVQDDGGVTIGDNFMAGPNVTLSTPLHPLSGKQRAGMVNEKGETFIPCYAKPITIGNDVWLCAGVIVCAGVTIGDGAVIGAGSVVTHDIPAGVLAYGVPCRVIREITEEDEKAMEALI